MTIDNLVAAELVLADGRIVRASADEHPDLYWAIRGGGGNFGVVTAFELRLHPLGPEVFSINVAYPIADAARVLAAWRDAVAGAPDELSSAAFTGRSRTPPSCRSSCAAPTTSASPGCGPATRRRASAPRGSCASSRPRCST